MPRSGDPDDPELPGSRDFLEPEAVPWRLPTPGSDDVVPGIHVDATRPHSARIWNYWLGGKDNYAIDREVGERVAERLPSIVRQAREDRAFLRRVVRYLAGECAVFQFLDIGTGLPTADNTHEVAQALVPECRIVYIDNDPAVLTHARALLASTPQGMCSYYQADLAEPDFILDLAARTLEPSRPVAVLLLGVLHHLTDDKLAYEVVRTLVDALPHGSYLAINHATSAVHGSASIQAAGHWNKVGKPQLVLRRPDEIAEFFSGLELLEPGIVSCSQWRPDIQAADTEPEPVDEFCGVGRKL